jgi:putative phage-type endonuclease
MEEEQRSAGWFARRLGKATASRFSDVCATIKSGEAAQRRNYRAELVIERITGEKAVTWTTPAMQWGIDNEPIARLAYEAETGEEVQEASFVEHPLLAAGASPDGYIGADGLIEIKCPNTATHIETLRKQSVPKQYMDQIMGQLWITGRRWCDFVSFDPRLPVNAQLFITRINRDETHIETLEEDVTHFLEEVDKELEFVQAYGK